MSEICSKSEIAIKIIATQPLEVAVGTQVKSRFATFVLLDTIGYFHTHWKQTVLYSAPTIRHATPTIVEVELTQVVIAIADKSVAHRTVATTEKYRTTCIELRADNRYEIVLREVADRKKLQAVVVAEVIY